MSEAEDIPIFPLQTVLFPGGVLPLRLFEARYLDMLSECLRMQRGFGICAIRSGAETGRAADCYAIGTLVRILDFDRDDDNLLNIVVQGERRFRIVARRVMPNQLLRAEVAWLDDSSDCALAAQYHSLAELLSQLLRRAGTPYAEMPTDYEHAAWVVGRLTELLPFALHDKQRLLEMDVPSQRLETLYRELLAEEFRR